MIYRVEGFTFGTEEEARLAGKEAEGIKYIRAQNNMDDPNTVFKLYNRLVEKEIFTTAVGLTFLKELRRFLLAAPGIRQKDLIPLPGESSAEPAAEEAEVRRTVVREEHKAVPQVPVRDYYRPFLVSTFLAVVFATALIGIFIIMALSSDNITILNYENQLIDRYEEWEKDLSRRERELKERERVLEAQEDTQWRN